MFVLISHIYAAYTKLFWCTTIITCMQVQYTYFCFGSTYDILYAVVYEIFFFECIIYSNL